MSTTKRTSKELTQCLEGNDPSLTKLLIHLSTGDCPYRNNKNFMKYDTITVQNNTEFINLGKSIGNNTQLKRIAFCRCNRRTPGAATTRQFINGFKCNESINDIAFASRIDFSQGLGLQLMNFYKSNNKSLRNIYIETGDLRNGGYRAIVNTLRECNSMICIRLRQCGITGKGMGGIVSAIKNKCNNNLRVIRLTKNPIGSRGCSHLAEVLHNPKTKLVELGLSDCHLNDNSIKILAKSLKKNNKLRHLLIDRNPDITRIGNSRMSKLLCNKSSINATYNSNHTIKCIASDNQRVRATRNFRKSLLLNGSSNKNSVAKNKILRCHEHLSMEPFFEWDLKVLPIAIHWLETARGNLLDGTVGNIDARKLSAIYEFARMMPLFFVPAPPKQGKKRKHSMMTRSRKKAV